MAAIEKVYNLKSIGGNDVWKDFDRLNKILLEIKKNKIDLNNILKESAGSKELSETAKKLEDLKVREKEVGIQLKEINLLHKQRQEYLAKEAEAQAKVTEAEKTAAAEQKKAAAAKEKFDKQLQTAQTREIKDIEQAVKAEEKRAAALKKTADAQQALLDKQKAAAALAEANKPTPGSYNDIATQYKQLSATYKNTVSLSDTAGIERATADLLALRTQLDAFNRSLTHDKVLIGEYSSGIAKAFHQLGLGSLVTDQVNAAKASLQGLNTEFGRLAAELQEIKSTGAGNLDAVERQLIENRQAAAGLESQLAGVQAELRTMGGIGSQMAQQIGNEFKNLKQQFVSFVVGYMGFQQVISGIYKSIDVNYKLSDSFGDIQNRMHGTNAEVTSLIDSLKGLDTRSSLSSLVDIGALISKKGVAKEEIAGVTQSIDNLMVALGSEIGDPHEAISSLIKLVNVYSEDKHVTVKNIDAIGGAIARLTTTGVATGGFLIQFAERMGGVRGVTGITIDKVLGLGAALEELGQRTETSGTAMSQMVVKLFSDYEHYAELLEMSKGKYLEHLGDDVLGTFVLVAEKLKGNAGEIEHFFEGLSDMHLKGARGIGVLGDVASNIDYVRKRMTLATAAMKEQGVVAEMAANKQHNFAASVDRIKKEFELLSSSKGFSAGLLAVSNLILILIKNLPTLIKLSALMLVGWIAQNTTLTLLRLQLIGYNIAIGTYRVLLGATTILQAAYAASLAVITGEYSIATAAAALFNTVLEASPIGAVAIMITALVGAAALLTTGIYYLSEAIQGNAGALSAQARELMLNQQITNKVNEKTADQTAKIKLYTAVVKDNTASLESKRHALDDLIAISPEYLKGLTLENIKTKEGTEIINTYIEALKKKSAYEAAAAIQSEKQREDVKLQALEYSLLQKKATGKSNNNDLSEEESKYLSATSRNLPFFSSVIDRRKSYYGETFADEALAGVKAAREKIKAELDVTDKIVKQKYEAMDRAGDSGSYTYGGAKPRKIGDIEKDIKAVTIKLRHAIEGSKEAIELHKQLLALKAELKKAMGNEGHGHGTKLTVDEYEGRKVIDANRDNKIVALRLAYTEQEETRKIYNGRMIDNERTFQEELQKIEEGALREKIALINGHKPAEQQARARYNLELLESQKTFRDKFYKMDLEELNADRETKATTAKEKLDNVDNDSQATELDKTTAKLEYYNTLEAQYMEYMAAMNALEARYNMQSEKNMAARGKVLEGLQRQQGKALLDIQKDSIANETAELKALTDAQMRELLSKRIEKTAQIIKNPNITATQKKRRIDKLNERLEKESLNISEQNVDRELELNQFLYDNKLITAKEYYAKLDELRQAQLDNTVKRNDLEVNKDAKTKKIRDAAIGGSIQIFEQLSGSYMQMLERQAEQADKNASKQLDWNKKILDSQVQSNQQKYTTDKIYALQQEQMEKAKLQRNKENAKTQMAIDYATGVMRIWANYKGDLGITEGIETGVLTGIYFAKLAMMDQYGEGGDVPGGGGEFGGQAHGNGGTPFTFRGRAFEAEAKELAIINKNSAGSNTVLSVTGTPRQIASGINSFGGGRSFAPGAKMYKFEYGGMLGAQVQAPAFITAAALRSSAGRDNHDDKLAEMVIGITNTLQEHGAALARMSSIPVVLNPNTVTNYQDKQSKAVKAWVL